MASEKPTDIDPEAAPTGPRLGGAKADFVASLGRKIADLRALMGQLEGAPDSAPARDELRRKLHALGSGARMLHFEGMTQCIVDTEGVLDRATLDGQLRPTDLERIARALDELPALAWGEDRPVEARRSAPPPAVEAEADTHTKKPLAPAAVSVLVIGPEDLADMLVDDEGAATESQFDIERIDDLTKARSLALAVAPDVVVLDGDLERSQDFAEQLLDDPLTDAAPVIVTLTPGKNDGSTRFQALGAAKVLPRPLLAGALRAACQEAIDQRDGKTIKMTLGEPTVAQLGERLAQEVRRAIIDGVDPSARGKRVKLGDGAEVWGALWGAIARVRQVVTSRTDGAVQFRVDGPEGALAFAPALVDAPAASRTEGGRNRDEAMDVALTGRRVIVADDDPAVTWFIADLLRSAGAVVHEALDGRSALRMAYELSPELVISDILMPGLDGFALCRALRRDVALRDTPVILLSWKEDLLQRVRELGASASAYLRKESDARAILARVREVMRPRARIGVRLRGDGEVRGRLDGLTVRTLLDLVMNTRPAARVSVRDASFLYEVELRGGGIRRASRTAGDGTFLRGDRVIGAMLGVGAGRFVVSSMKPGSADEPPVSLAEQFSKPIALARSALHATTGARMMTVEKLVLDEDDISGYVLATPEPAKELVKDLARGTAPRDLLLRGDVSASLVEDVLADLATRGAIIAVYRADGSDAMRSEAFDAAAVLPDADGKRSSVAPPRAPWKPPQIVTSDNDPLAAAVGPGLTPTPAADPAPPKEPATKVPEPSVPVTVEPTEDLRPKVAAEPGALSRPRPSPKGAEVEEEAAGFPRSLAIGLIVLGLLIAGLGARTYLMERSAVIPPPPTAPVVQDAPGVTFGELPSGVPVAAGQGLVSVTVGEGVPVRIDGNDAPGTQKGKPLRMPLPPGVHLVSVGTGDKARSRIIEIRAARATNVMLDEP